MGFIQSATSLTVIANLTTIGRQKLLINSSNLISHFALGDSDANYNAELPLSSSTVPVVAGYLSTTSGATNSLNNNFQLRSKLIRGVTSGGANPTTQNTRKLVEASSGNVISEKKLLGVQTVSASSLTQMVINRTDINGESSRLTNLFKSFNLPITSGDKAYFESVPYPNGFANTALSGFNQDNVLVIALPNDSYGEVIDGKTIKMDITVTGLTADTVYTIYSSYQSTLTTTQVQDNNNVETSGELVFGSNSSNPQLIGYNKFGNNVSVLFSDTIAKPNQDSTKSWATGHNTFKPFSLNGKEQYNLVTNTNLSKSADTAIGLAYLDQGFIVITEPKIVDYFSDTLSSATTVSYNSITNEVSQKITCLVSRGEFGTTTNPTFSVGNNDVPRVTEVSLLDSANTIIAVAKLDRQVELSNDMFLALGVKIVL